MATIYDVAKASGVSAKTVSRVMNGDGPVSAKTQKIVTEAMSALGYVPSKAARSMRSQKSGLVGVISGSFTGDPGDLHKHGLPIGLALEGIQQVLTGQSLTAMMADPTGRAENILPLAQTFMQHRVEGLLIVADHYQKISLPEMPHACPIVLLNCFDDAGSPCVLPDDYAGQSDLVARLIAEGHRQIGMLALPEHLVASQLREEGYRFALAEAGLSPNPQLVRHLPPDESNAALHAAVDHFLSLEVPPSVICCGNDLTAMRVYGYLRSKGVRIPTDISITGYDDYRLLSEGLYPPLTTAELPYSEMGKCAAELLMSLIGGTDPKPTGPLFVAGETRWRASVLAQK